ncbi:MAG: hypothetical protein R2822_11340 [Spirosomataceae bacterium]
MSETLTPPIAPTDASMTTLAGSFFSIKAANKAILLQPPLLLPEHDDSTGDDVISNLRQVNDALQKAQAHATHWQTDVSINVQNQLQQIVVQADFSSSIGEPLEEVVSRLQTMSKDNLSSIRSTLDEIHDYAEALADNINDILYGSGKTIADYTGDDYPTHTIYGSYKQLGEYQKAITDDHNNFSDYLNKLLSDDKGIDEEIKPK